MTLNSLNENAEWWNEVVRFKTFCKENIWNGIEIKKTPLYFLEVSADENKDEIKLSVLHVRTDGDTKIPHRSVELTYRDSEFVFKMYDVGGSGEVWKVVDSEFVGKFLDWLKYEIDKQKTKEKENVKKMLIKVFAWDESEPILKSLI